MAGDTRAKLRAAAGTVLADRGIVGASARAIADEAGVNQALIFYHFGSVTELIDVTCRARADERVDYYRQQFAAVGSLGELLQVGRALHERERAEGNVAIMAQLLAGAQDDETLAATARYALSVWAAEIETVLARLLAGGPLAEIADVPGLARAVSAAFVGLELYDGVDAVGAAAALDGLERLAVLADVMDDLGPVARRALRARVRRRGK